MSTLYENDKVREESERIVKNEVIHRANELCGHMINIDHEFMESMINYDYSEPASDWLYDLESNEQSLSEYLEHNEISLIDLRLMVEQSPEQICDNEGLEPHYIEVLEFWIVSDYLAGELSLRGQAIGELFDFNIWGRTTSGQAISMDYIMLKIAESHVELREG